MFLETCIQLKKRVSVKLTMLRSEIKARYRKKEIIEDDRLYQGDILKDLSFVTGAPEKEEDKELIYLRYAIILSQDCDLERDFNDRESNVMDRDKYLRSLLVCPAFDLETFSQGKHLGDDWLIKTKNTGDIEKIKQNDSLKRYHFLLAEKDPLVPELVLDFKHFFTLPRDFLYKQKKEIYVASLNEIFREELSQRFSNYLSRIGLPEIAPD